MTPAERLTAALAGAVGGVLAYLITESIRTWLMYRSYQSR